MDGCAFATRRTSKKMSQDRAQQNERRHADRDDRTRIMNLFEDQVVAGFHGAAEVFIQIADREAGRRKKQDHPDMFLAEIGSPH